MVGDGLCVYVGSRGGRRWVVFVHVGSRGGRRWAVCIC